MPTCVLKSCDKYYLRAKDISFHRFPVDPILSARWTAIVRQSRQESSWTPKTYDVICSAHFLDSYFYTTKCQLRRLRKEAIPTEMLGESIETQNTCKQEESNDPLSTSPTNTAMEELPILDRSNAILYAKLKRKTVLESIHKQKIKTLNQKVRRVKEANDRLKGIITSLRTELKNRNRNGSTRIYCTPNKLYSAHQDTSATTDSKEN